MEILRCENVTKIYQAGEEETRALDGVSFSVEKGEFVSIVGRSGSGKSTLLHIIGGVDRPTSGSVYIKGTDIHSLDEDELAVLRRREIGIIYQFYNLLPVLNVDENILLPNLLDGHGADMERLDEIVSRLGLKERRNNLPSQLSGGQQQRVAIGRALFNRPAIVLADEPTGNLDSANSGEIMQLLRKANREQKQTLIVITHDDEVAMQADRVICIEDGRIKKDERIRAAGGND